MVPARQPKSLLRALKGSIVGPATMEGKDGDVDQESQMLESERARSQLATITTADDSALVGRAVQSTRLLMRDFFAARIKEE